MAPRIRLAAVLTTALAALCFVPAAASAAPGTYGLENLEVDLPACVQIVEREEGALLFSNGCKRSFSVTPVESDCPGCDPEITLAPGEMGWYGLASPLPGDEARVAGPRVATWFEDGGRSGALTARLVFMPAEIASGGCAVHPAASGGAAGFAMLFGLTFAIRRRRRLLR